MTCFEVFYICWSVLLHMLDVDLLLFVFVILVQCLPYAICRLCLMLRTDFPLVHVCALCHWRPWYPIALLFARAFERPSFGNGEVPLWSVAVCVSGRFNNSCHRINFHSRENRDCSWLCASFASEFGLSRLAWDGACRKASLYTTKFWVSLWESWLSSFPFAVP